MSFWQQVGIAVGVYFAIAIPVLLFLCRELKAIGEEFDQQ